MAGAPKKEPVMNSLKVEFQFDFGSPNAYLAELVIPEIERRTGVKFDYVPVLLGGIYKATNNMSPAESLRGIKNKPEGSGRRPANLSPMSRSWTTRMGPAV
jgi:DSBA-like thioredoxin domain